MSYYPIAIDLTDKNVLVVGGGSVALRKTETLLEFGAVVTVVSPEISDNIERIAKSNRVTLIKRSYLPSDIVGMTLVIAATDDRAVNSEVSKDSQAAGIPVNVVDDPELCSFIVQSVVRRGDLTISIGTGGKSPALSKRVRKLVEKEIGPEYGELAELLGEMRELAKEQLPEQADREITFNRMLDSDILELIKSGRSEEAKALAMNIMGEGKTNP